MQRFDFALDLAQLNSSLKHSGCRIIGGRTGSHPAHRVDDLAGEGDEAMPRARVGRQRQSVLDRFSQVHAPEQAVEHAPDRRRVHTLVRTRTHERAHRRRAARARFHRGIALARVLDHQEGDPCVQRSELIRRGQVFAREDEQRAKIGSQGGVDGEGMGRLGFDEIGQRRDHAREVLVRVP